MKLYIAEKPSLAKEIAKALGAKKTERTHIILNNNDVVTWQFGHIFEQYMPEDYDPVYKRWKLQHLPIIPPKWKLQPKEDAKSQVLAIKNLLKDASLVVNAGDPDREGQLLVDETLQELNWTGPVQRLWVTDLTKVKEACENTKDNKHYQGFSDAALARSRADWLIGLNFTRAFTMRHQSAGGKGVLSVGRVVTPTLRLVVDREREIRNFKPKDYYELQAEFKIASGQYTGKLLAPEDIKDSEGYVLMKESIQEIAKKIENQDSTVKQADRKKNSTQSPMAYTLADLQKACSSKYKMGAKKVLDIAQSLYEKHKVSTYPRSESSYLSMGQHAQAPSIFPSLVKMGIQFDEQKAVASRIHKVFDDSKLKEHHGIIPTGNVSTSMTPDEKKVFELISKRYLALFYPDKKTETLNVVTTCGGFDFSTRATRLIDAGWTEIDGTGKKEDLADLPNIQRGDDGQCVDYTIDSKKTKPPAYFTEGTLIDAMKEVAKFVQDPVIKKKLRATSGIGTSATRADIIEKIKKTGLVEVIRDKIHATQKGEDLIDSLPEKITDPGMTAIWEDALMAIEEQKLSVEAFTKNQEGWIAQVIDKALHGVEDVFSKPSKKQVELALAIVETLKIDEPDYEDRDIVVAFIEANIEEFKKSVDYNPTDKLLDYVRNIAQTLSIDLPDGYETSSKKCSAFIEKNVEDFKASVDYLPSDKTISFVENIARSLEIDLPTMYKESSKRCSAFIEENKRAFDALVRPPTEGQIKFAQSLAERNEIDLPEGFDKDSKICRAFIEKYNKSSGTKGKKRRK
ncbi:MAG: DNA topoisomerase 3 [Methyloprofundus sp.]|nr:DNA topoisomerase 3 [Methyloprofundus sp.]